MGANKYLSAYPMLSSIACAGIKNKQTIPVKKPEYIEMSKLLYNDEKKVLTWWLIFFKPEQKVQKKDKQQNQHNGAKEHHNIRKVKIYVKTDRILKKQSVCISQLPMIRICLQFLKRILSGYHWEYMLKTIRINKVIKQHGSKHCCRNEKSRFNTFLEK